MIVQRDNNLDRVTKMKNMKPQQHQLLLEEIETGVYDELDPTHSLGKQEQLENKIKLLQVLFFDDSNVLIFFKTISSPSFSPVSLKIIIKYKPNRFAKTEEETKDKNEEEEEEEIPEEEIPEEEIPEEIPEDDEQEEPEEELASKKKKVKTIKKRTLNKPHTSSGEDIELSGDMDVFNER